MLPTSWMLQGQGQYPRAEGNHQYVYCIARDAKSQNNKPTVTTFGLVWCMEGFANQGGPSSRKLRVILGLFSQSLRNNSSQSWCFNWAILVPNRSLIWYITSGNHTYGGSHFFVKMGSENDFDHFWLKDPQYTCKQDMNDPMLAVGCVSWLVIEASLLVVKETVLKTMKVLFSRERIKYSVLGSIFQLDLTPKHYWVDSSTLEY